MIDGGNAIFKQWNEYNSVDQLYITNIDIYTNVGGIRIQKW